MYIQMNKLTLALLMLLPQLAHAEWQLIDRSTNVHVGHYASHVDTKTFVTIPGAGSVSLLLEHDEPQFFDSQAYRSARMRLYVNCDSRMYRLENITLYTESMGVGKVVAIQRHDTLLPVDNDTSVAGLLSAAICDKISQHVKR